MPLILHKFLTFKNKNYEKGQAYTTRYHFLICTAIVKIFFFKHSTNHKNKLKLYQKLQCTACVSAISASNSNQAYQSMTSAVITKQCTKDDIVCNNGVYSVDLTVKQTKNKQKPISISHKSLL